MCDLSPLERKDLQSGFEAALSAAKFLIEYADAEFPDEFQADVRNLVELRNHVNTVGRLVAMQGRV